MRLSSIRDGLVYAALAESTIPAGTVRHIETAAAERAPGVLLVLTHNSAPKLPYKAFEQRPAVEPVSGEPLRALQDAEVKFCGQPIAIVVAKKQAQAEYARLTCARILRWSTSTFDDVRSSPQSAYLESC